MILEGDETKGKLVLGYYYMIKTNKNRKLDPDQGIRRKIMKDRTKKIKLIHPVTTNLWDELTLNEINKYKENSTLIDIGSLKVGLESIECELDNTWSAVPTIQEVMKAEKDGYDGVIINNFSEAGIHAAKESVEIPVIGIGQASFYIASLLGEKFGMITGGSYRYRFDNLKIYELDHKFIGSRSVGIPVLSLFNDKDKLVKVLLKSGIELIEKGADVIVLACGAMLGVKEKIAQELGVPIIIPIAAAITLCESLITMGLAQSKKAYPNPPPKKRFIC